MAAPRKPGQKKPLVTETEARRWYAEHLGPFQALEGAVTRLIAERLKQDNAAYFQIKSRVKGEQSAIDKVAEKGYVDLRRQLSDVLGIRVIVFLNSDMPPVGNAINSLFRVYPNLSGDKSIGLGPDRVGYRSVHYVCELGGKRYKLPEYASFNGLLFEVQIRTVLAHAWAEIEHAKQYTSKIAIPESSRRKLHLVAGLLEMADRDLSDAAREIDENAQRIAAASEDAARALDATSLHDFVVAIAAREQIEMESLPLLPLALRLTTRRNIADELLDELRMIGITDKASLERIFSPQFISIWRRDRAPNTWVGTLRDAMMYDDLHLYFARAYQRHWVAGDDGDAFLWLEERYDADDVAGFVAMTQSFPYDDDDDEEEDGDDEHRPDD